MAISSALLVASCGARSGEVTTTPSRNLNQIEFSSFEQLDEDDDDALNHEEFHAAIATFREACDNDNDGLLGPTELSAGFFNLWDRNGDGLVHRGEFQHGAEAWLPVNRRIDLGEWDGDASGSLELEEVGAGIRDQDVVGQWDGNGDGSIDSRELSIGVFTRWDENGDSAIDALEWRVEE